MRNKVLIFSLLSLVLVVHSGLVTGQKTQIAKDPEAAFRKARELFDKEKYAPAREIFSQLSSDQSLDKQDLKMDAALYTAMCAIELYNKDAESLSEGFLETYPAHPRINDLVFRMSRHLYQKKNYKHCGEWMEKINKALLREPDLSEYYFKKGYCHFSNGDRENARLCFYEIKDTDNAYSGAATYFYSHLAYEDKNYQTALVGFRRLSDDETFSGVVPYYVTQIYFLKGDYDALLDYAPAVLDSATPARAAEIARFIGEAHFKKNQYTEAIPYLERAREEGTAPGSADDYQLGYAYYQTGKWEKAAGYFQKSSSGNDTLAQNAFYHLGDCFIRLKEKNKALMAFSAASRFQVDPEVREEALFNYAKLSFETSNSPFNQTITAFNAFIETFPFSDHLNEAYMYLMRVYMVTKNYGEALGFIEKIDLKAIPDSMGLRKAFQRVLFFRGVELFNDLNFEGAIGLFDRSIPFGRFDPQILNQTHFWRAEALFRTGNMEKAAQGYRDFMKLPGTFSTREYQLATYGLAYCAYSTKQTPEAITSFRKFTSEYKGKDRFLSDAFLRLADCYYLSRNYPEAVINYDKGLALQSPESDYALFQKAYNQGLMGYDLPKIETMKDLLGRFPASTYCDDAQYEIAKTYTRINSPDLAADNYKKLIYEYPASEFVKSASLQLGLLYYNSDQNEKALAIYKELIEKYPNTPEAKSALLGVRNAYLDMHEEDEYFKYTQSLGDFASVSASEQDSLTFYSAEKLYMAGDCKKASEHLSKYIRNFPKGEFFLTAAHYLATCQLQSGDEENGLKSLRLILSQPGNEYTSKALREAARLEYKNKNMPQALDLFEKLEASATDREETEEALVNQLRINFQLENYEKALANGKKILNIGRLPDEIIRETRFKMAKSHFSLQQYDEALEAFRIIAKNTRTRDGAESKYRVAEILFHNRMYSQAEKEILEFNQGDSPHQFWIAKAIILLGDIYIQKPDLFQARHTFQSILDNYDIPGDGILDTCRQKIEQVRTLEEAEKARIQAEKDALSQPETLPRDSIPPQAPGLQPNGEQPENQENHNR